LNLSRSLPTPSLIFREFAPCQARKRSDWLSLRPRRLAGLRR
jgi:hypothetical protein